MLIGTTHNLPAATATTLLLLVVAAAAGVTTTTVALAAATGVTTALATLLVAALAAAVSAIATTVATASTTAAKAASTATGEAAATSTALGGFVNTNGTSVELDVVHCVNGSVSISLLSIANESEATAATGVTVLNNDSLLHNSELLKLHAESILVGVPSQASDEELRHGGGLT